MVSLETWKRVGIYRLDFFPLLTAPFTGVQIHAQCASSCWSANLKGTAALYLMRSDRTMAP